MLLFNSTLGTGCFSSAIDNIRNVESIEGMNMGVLRVNISQIKSSFNYIGFQSLFLLFSMLLAAPFISQAEQSNRKDDLVLTVLTGLEEWTQRLKSLNVSYKINVETTDQGMTFRGLASGLSKEAAKTLKKWQMQQEIWAEGPKLRLETMGPQISKRGDVVEIRPITRTVNNGIVKDHFHKSKTAESTFILDKKDSSMVAHIESIYDFGAYVCGMPLKDFIQSPQWHIIEASVRQLNDNEYVFLEVRGRDNSVDKESPSVKLWLDPAKNFLIKRLESYTGSGALGGVGEAEFSEVAPGLWLPVSGTHKIYIAKDKAGSDSLILDKTKQLESIKLEDFYINEDIDDEIFDQSVPFTAHVHDRIKGIDYFVGDHSGASVSIFEIMDKEIDELVLQEKNVLKFAHKMGVTPTRTENTNIISETGSESYVTNLENNGNNKSTGIGMKINGRYVWFVSSIFIIGLFLFLIRRKRLKHIEKL